MKQYLYFGVLWMIALIVVYFYYIGYPIHGEVKDKFFFLYLFLIGSVYACYKAVQIIGSYGQLEVRTSTLIFGFLIQYVLICMYSFVVVGQNAGLGLVLFFKSMLFLLFVSLLWLSIYYAGKQIVSMNRNLQIEDPNISNLLSISVGFIVFVFGMFLLASFGWYNVYGIIGLLGVFIAAGGQRWKGLIFGYNQVLGSYSQKSSQLLGNTRLFINEMLFMVITFLLSVNFVSVFRPFPIGWDDLGAYMNYPKLLSSAGEHLALGKMYSWELYTGIGFLFGSQTLAFYLNSFSAVIAAIVVYISISIFTENKSEKYSLGLLFSLVFLMMPMVVFQAAKDMKLDLGLFSMSIIAIVVLYYLLFTKKKYSYFLYVFVGIIIGFAFSIKVTSLLLLLGALAAITYNKFKLLGFFSFFFLFSGIFSLLGLWKVINVNITTSSISLNQIGGVFIILGIALLAGALLLQKKHKTDSSYLNFFVQIGSIIFGFCIALTPWVIKHIGEIPKDFNTTPVTIISGVSDRYQPNYESIYSPEELKEITNSLEKGVNESGTTSNEDFGRYLGYEKGINNFLKLPWNLTLQINQKGEFTDITFLFLALLPGVFLFLRYKREEYKYPLIFIIVLVLLYYIPGSVSIYLTQLFSTINLPAGYIPLIIVFVSPLVYLSFTLEKSKLNSLFLVNLAGSTMFIGLWAVSAFGIVWYGIAMYFMMMFMVALCLHSVRGNEKSYNVLSYSLLALVSIYALQSSIAHGITNLKTAGYTQYKIGSINEEVSLMTYHPDYFPIMFEINIADEKKEEVFVEYRKQLLTAISPMNQIQSLLPQIQEYTSISELHRLMDELLKIQIPEVGVSEKVSQIRQNLYELIIYTPDEYKNTQNIYRVGTFLKYFISQNNERLLEDSLIKKFESYIYDENDDVVYDRLKKLNLGYILLDLNAATIDQDPAKNLTQRYEHLLRFTADDRIELIETDSICLRVAIDSYKNSKNIERFLTLGTVNHNYDLSIPQKREACFKLIRGIISDENALLAYPYLRGYKQVLENAGVDINNEKEVVTGLNRVIRGSGSMALFKIN